MCTKPSSLSETSERFADFVLKGRKKQLSPSSETSSTFFAVADLFTLSERASLGPRLDDIILTEAVFTLHAETAQILARLSSAAGFVVIKVTPGPSLCVRVMKVVHILYQSRLCSR